MDTSELAIIEKVLPTLIGKTATVYRYSRAAPTTMKIVMDEAAKQISTEFLVYWVDDGVPEHFSLSGFSPTPVVYNSRYIELIYLLNRLMTLDVPNREELAERTCLKIMAEFSLPEGDADWAVLAFVKSILGQSLSIADVNGLSIMDLETAPMSEAYMCIWFFALLHELGHFPTKETPGTLFSKASIDHVLRYALGNFPYPQDVKEAALSTARERSSTFVLELEHLRKEVLADVFAASILLRTTPDLLNKNQKPFQIDQFIFQVTLFINLMSLLERCRLLARFAVTPSVEVRETILYLPVAHHVRVLMLHEYLQRVVSEHYFNSRDPSEQQLHQIRQLFDPISIYIGTRISQVEKGLDRAMRFALFANEREPNLLEEFETQMAQPGRGLGAIEGQIFCDRAASLGATGENFDRLRRSLKQ